MARGRSRPPSLVPQGRGAPQRHRHAILPRSGETVQDAARTGQIGQALPENGPSTDLAVGIFTSSSSNGLNNPHASLASPAHAERREMRRAVPLYQGPGANIWGSGLFRASTTGGYPPVTAAATTTPSGHAPDVLGDPPPQGDDKPGTYAGGDKGEHLEVVRTTGWRTGELRVNDQVYTTGSPRTALAAAPATPGGRSPRPSAARG